MPDLAGRKAKCYAGCPVVDSRPDLPFFQYRGPGSKDANEICAHCGYHMVAHTTEGMAGNVPSNRRTVIEMGKCPGPFMPHGPYEFDLYFCGCTGLD